MAASMSRRSMCVFQKVIHCLPYRQISIFQSECVPFYRSNFRVPNPRLYWYSSTPTAAQNQSAAEKPVNAEGDQSSEKESASQVSPKEKELVLENEKLLENVQTLNDKYKRALADNENIRNRMRREIADSKQYSIQGFVKDLVEVVDVLGTATESVPKEALNEGNVHLKSLFEGLKITDAHMRSVLKRHGVTQINPIGEKFNPNHHEALFEQEDVSKEPGTVGTVTKVGYMLHDRIVRPAMVGVVKGKS